MNLQKHKHLNQYIGDAAFYRTLFAVVLPIMLQNGLSTFVNLLDNIMVGSVGTEQMSGVSIVNQLLFVFNLCLFGGVGGAGIFTAQFFGKRDDEGIRHTFRFKLLLSLGLFAAGLTVFLCFGKELIALYLHEGGETGDIALTAVEGQKYLSMMLFGLLPFAIVQTYASTLRECGETILPMKAGIAAIFTNLIGNYILIFGNFGAPKMGTEGAALATVISRWVELSIVVIWTHRHPEKMPFIRGVYRRFTIPKALCASIAVKGLPLLLNETLWSAGQAALTQSYSTRGLAVVAAMNVATTISNLFNILWISMGTAVSILVGQQLGAGEFERVKVTSKRLLAFSVTMAVTAGAVLFLLAPLFPQLYNTTDEVRDLAVGFMRVTAVCSPLYAYCNVAYFMLRAGGRTGITFLFDSVYLWVFKIPVTRLIIRDAGLFVVLVFAIVEALDLVKCILGFILIKKGVWLRNIVSEPKP